ncbi:MAG: hypothetical protein R2698_09090 [Microthrixaceae bacterium]
MNTTREVIASLGIAATLVGGVGAAAGAATSTAPPSTAPSTATTSSSSPGGGPDHRGARAAFVCAHRDEIEDLATRRTQLLKDRMALLEQAAAAATEHPVAAKRIGERMTKAGEMQERIATRTDRLRTWIGEHC